MPLNKYIYIYIYIVTPTDVPVSDDSGQTDDARVISFAVVRAGCLSVCESLGGA